MRRLLVVAGWYPPCQAWPTAARRIATLVHGLAAAGWQPTVLAPDLRDGLCSCDACRRGVEADDPFVRRVPVRPSLLRRTVRRLGRRSSIDSGGGSAAPGSSRRDLGWALLGMQTTWEAAAVERARTVDADALLTTAGPFENVRIGDRIALERSLPWVADLRDPASVDVTFEGTRAEWLVRAARRSLRERLGRADRVIAATGQVVDKDSAWLDRPVELLIPGFDDAEWAAARHGAPERHDRFEIVFTGRLYPGYRGPTTFLRGLRLFAEGHPGADLRLVYFGRDGAVLRAEAASEGCAALVEDRGFVNPADVPGHLIAASLLLLLTNDVADSGVPGGKFFEYLGARRPILAVPGGDRYVDITLARTGAGVSASTPEAVASNLSTAYAAWQETGCNPFLGSESEVAAFSSTSTIRRLDAILRELVPQGRP